MSQNTVDNIWVLNKWLLLENNRATFGKKIKLYSYVIPNTKINSKRIGDINVKTETIQVRKLE